MIRNVKRMSAYVLTAAIAFSGMSITAQASGSILPGGGVSLALSNGNKLEDITTDVPTMPIQSIMEWMQEVDEDVPSQPTEEDLFKNLVIAQVTNYVNVRSLPSEEGEILGKLYNNSVGTFEIGRASCRERV